MRIKYHEICSSRGVLVSEVKRINSKCLLELEFILHPETAASHHVSRRSLDSATTDSEFNQPERSAVEVDHHPLGRVEDKRMCKFNAF